MSVRTAATETTDRTPATAFATIGHAAGMVQNPGVRVLVGPGTYAEGNIEPARSGIAGRPVEFLADPTGAATGDAPGPVRVMPPGGVLSTGFILLGKHHVIFDGFTIIGAVDAGIQVLGRPTGRRVGRTARR